MGDQNFYRYCEKANQPLDQYDIFFALILQDTYMYTLNKMGVLLPLIILLHVLALILMVVLLLY